MADEAQAPAAVLNPTQPSSNSLNLPLTFTPNGEMAYDASGVISPPINEQGVPNSIAAPAPVDQSAGQSIYAPESQVAPPQSQISNVTPESQFAIPSQVAQSSQVAVQPSLEQQYFDQMQKLAEQQKTSNKALESAALEKTAYDVKQNQALANEAGLARQAELNTMKQRAVAFDNADKSLKNIADDYQKTLEQKVDPNKFWETRTEGQNVAAGIAIFLGGLAGGISGKGGNLALDLINKSIDRDIDAQKTNIQMVQQGKLHQYDMQNNLVAQMYKRFQNEDQAVAAARMLRLQQVQYQLNAAAGKYQGAEVSAKTQMANTQLDQQQAKLRMDIGNIEIQKTAQRQLMQALNTQGGVENLSPAQFSMLPKELQERSVPGYGFARTPEDRKAFQEKRGEVEPLIGQINEVQTLLQNYNRITDPLKREEMETRIDTIRGRLGAALIGTKRFSADEIKFVSQALGNPAGYMSIRPLAEKRFNTFKNVLQEDLDSAATMHGLSPRPKPSAIKSFQPR